MKKLCIFFLLFSSLQLSLRCLGPASKGAVRDQWLMERMETVTPELMRRAGIDMWILISGVQRRSGAENHAALQLALCPPHDHALPSMTPETLWKPGMRPVRRRRSVQKAWDKDKKNRISGNGWRRSCRNAIRRRSPSTDREHFGLADGLSSYHYDKLMESLPVSTVKEWFPARRLPSAGWKPAPKVKWSYTSRSAASPMRSLPRAVRAGDTARRDRHRRCRLVLPRAHPRAGAGSLVPSTVDVQRHDSGGFPITCGRSASAPIKQSYSPATLSTSTSASPIWD